MSRVAKNPITIPDLVKVNIEDSNIQVSGSKGSLDFQQQNEIGARALLISVALPESCSLLVASARYILCYYTRVAFATLQLSVFEQHLRG